MLEFVELGAGVLPGARAPEEVRRDQSERNLDLQSEHPGYVTICLLPTHLRRQRLSCMWCRQLLPGGAKPKVRGKQEGPHHGQTFPKGFKISTPSLLSGCCMRVLGAFHSASVPAS